MPIKARFSLATVLLFFIGCTKMCGPNRMDMTPEQVVEAYLNLSLNMDSLDDKAQLVNLTVGNLRTALLEASDETFEKAFINKNFNLESYSVVERRDRTPRETEITFLLSYKNLGKNREVKPDLAPHVTTENTVSVIKHKGAWAIKDVLGKKTSIDFPVLETEVIKPGQ